MFGFSADILPLATFKQMLDAQKPVHLIDVRNPEDIENGKIEAKQALTFQPIAYETILKQGKSSDPVMATKTYFNEVPLKAKGQVVVVCWKGVCSKKVAKGLQALGIKALSLEKGMEGWRALHDVRQVVNTASVKVFQFSRPARGCLSYLVCSQGEAVIIDPLRETKPILKVTKEQGVTISRIFETHCHADHISGGPKLAQGLGVPYMLHPYDALHPFDLLPATFIYHAVWDADSFTLGTSKLKVIHIPGHTLGEVAYLLDDSILFAGDSLFLHGIARPDLGGKVLEWTPLYQHSLKKLLKLPDSTLVLPSHVGSFAEANDEGYFAATLGELKKNNNAIPKVLKSLEEFQEYIMASLSKFPEEYKEIKRINLGLKEASDAMASELESGQNTCALR